MTRSVLVAVLVLLGGCDLLFQVDEVRLQADASASTSADSAEAGRDAAHANCVVDDFATLPVQWAKFADSVRTVVAVDGSLSITLTKAAYEHGGIRSPARDVTGFTIEVDVVTVPDVSSETYMDWARGDDWYSIAVDHGELSYGYSVNGSQNTIEIPYDAQRHRGFRMAHDPAANVIRMSVRSTAGEWTQLGTVPAAIPLTAIQVELAAGSYTQSVTTGIARFDNFATCN